MALVLLDVTARPPHNREAATGETADGLRERYARKARAELAAADGFVPGADGVPWRGELLASVALIKGLPGPAEASGQPALAGADGDAADKALVALGFDPVSVFRTLSRPVPEADPTRRVARLRLQIETVDPSLVIALDDVAAADLRQALGLAELPFGVQVEIAGRSVVAVDGLEASLADPGRKRRVWRQLQAITPIGPVY